MPQTPELISNTKLLLLSPAFITFTFFMITDPRTSPKTLSGKLLYTLAVAMLHWFFISLGLGVKSLFLSLFIICTGVPLLNYITGTTLSSSKHATKKVFSVLHQ